jgi:hypothetical protein
LVGGPLEVRSDVFDAFRDLYSARSKLAHGATLDDMKPRDVVRVENALDIGPRVLRHLLLRFLEGGGPSGLDGRALTDWWRAVEFGDTVTPASKSYVDSSEHALDESSAPDLDEEE